MADQTTSRIAIDAPATQVMATIAAFEEYPDWAASIKRTEVTDRDSEDRPVEVRLWLDAGPLQEQYTLRYEWQESSVRWRLVQGTVLTEMDGSYELFDRDDGGTDVTYRLTVEIAVPVIGQLRTKAEKVIIDTALTQLKRRVETTQGS